MAGNLFSGTIPVEITNIQGLQILDMGPGVLTGTIPSEFGTLRELRKFVYPRFCFRCRRPVSERASSSIDYLFRLFHFLRNIELVSKLLGRVNSTPVGQSWQFDPSRIANK